MTFLVSYFLKPSLKLFDFTQWFNIINCCHSFQIKMYWALIFYCGAKQQQDKLNTNTHSCTNTQVHLYITFPGDILSRRSMVELLFHFFVGIILLETLFKTVPLSHPNLMWDFYARPPFPLCVMHYFSQNCPSHSRFYSVICVFYI